MNSILTVAAVAFCGIICALIVKERSSGFAFLITIATCLVLTSAIIPQIYSVYTKCRIYLQMTRLDNDIFIPLAKTVVIALITRYAFELCNDSGQRAIGVTVELSGTVIGMTCALPLLEKAIIMIGGM